MNPAEMKQLIDLAFDVGATEASHLADSPTVIRAFAGSHSEQSQARSA